MKKIILLSILMILVMIMSVVAPPPMPAFIRGYFTVNGHGMAGYIVEAKNLRTGEVISGDTIPSMVTEPGGFAFDLSQFKAGYYPATEVYAGDVIEVKVKGMADSTISFNAPEDTPYEITIAIDTTQTLYQCEDGSFVFDLDNCPEIPPTYICWDGSVVSDLNDCPVKEEKEETKVVSSDDKKSASVEAYFGQTINICLTDNKISTLLDKEIDYEEDNYDIHEEVCFKGIILTSIDDEDYGLNPYFVVMEEDITYKYIFEDRIPFEEFHIEEPGEITLLGKELKIIEASSDEITVRFGTEINLFEGKSETVDGTEITVIAIMKESVSVKVNNEVDTIYLDNIEKVGGLEIAVDEISYQGYADGIKHAVLTVGNKIEDTYKDGDDFELFIKDDETYKWVINLPDYIGIVNQEEYSSVDEDEEFKPITVNEYFALPNNYLVFNFKEISESDVIDMTFKVDDGYLNAKGDEDTFVFGSEEYDEINVKSDGIYDEDEVLITTDKVRIGDSDIYLKLGSVKIGKLEIKLDMSDILYDGISYLAKEENYLDYFGIIFEDPENAIDNKKGFEVSVPEERPEVTFSISSEAIIVEPTKPVIPITPIEPTEPVEPIEPVDEPVEPVEPVTPVKSITPVEPVEPVKPTEPEPKRDYFIIILEVLGVLLAIIGVKWRAGYMGLCKYYWKKGEKLRAIKMLLTATKRAKEDFYKKKENNQK